MRRPLAKDTNTAVERELAGCKNLGLILDKFQPWQPVSGQVNPGGWDLFMDGTRDKPAGLAARGAWFTGRVARGDLIDPWLNPNSRIEEGILASFRTRWRSAAAAAGAAVFPMWTESPLIIGLGAKGTLETAITLHPLYGFPYIPGSALKGIARAAAFFELAGAMGIDGVDNETYGALKKRKEKTPLQKLAEALDEGLDGKDAAKWPAAYQQFEKLIRKFRLLFGWRGGAGRAVFFDGVPARVPAIAPEVMTPHFKGYYAEGSPPDDADSPNPISLLAVARGTPFYFAVAPRLGPQDNGLRDKAILWLVKGLEELGLGGKTAAGYGFFQESKPKDARQPVGKLEADVSGYRNMNQSGTREEQRPRQGDDDPTKKGSPAIDAGDVLAALARNEEERQKRVKKK